MKKFGQKLYLASPNFIQTVLLNIYAYKLSRQRFGKEFERILSWFNETEKWSFEELKSYQEERLEIIISHAFETVPYYHDKMRSLKLLPQDIKTIEDLPKLSVVTKNDIKENLQRFISTKHHKKNLFHGHTSGTTGSPLNLYWDHGMVLMNNAVDWRQKKWAGFSLGDPHAVILGRIVVPIQKKSPPFWRINYIHNQLWLSAFHMSLANLALYVEKIEKFKPRFIEGYPSTLFILANFLIDNGKRLPLEAAFTSAETLFSHQKAVIEKAFECEIFDYYGMAERVVFATECQFHEGKHLNLEYGITEIVDEEGYPVKPGCAGKLIGTSLHNLGMPMIRYQTNDVSSIRINMCECGLSHPLIEHITTKDEDIIITPDGKWISPSVLTHPFKPQKNIVESQIIQERIGLLTVKIVKNDLFDLEDGKVLVNSLRERLGKEMDINLEFVQEIPREKSGKLRWVISRLPKH